MSGHPDTGAGEGALLDILLRHGESRPDAVALTSGADALSWGELKSQVLSLAGAIAAFKVPQGGHIAILGSNSANLVVTYLATVAAGRCAVPLPTSATAEALSAMIGNCEPHLVFADRRSAELLDNATGARPSSLTHLPERPARLPPSSRPPASWLAPSCPMARRPSTSSTVPAPPASLKASYIATRCASGRLRTPYTVSGRRA